MSVKNRVRKAGITIEMLLASVLAMVVMFMVLGLFSDNLKLMISSSNFNKLFKRTAATEYEKANRDYSESQVTVQVVAEQGLEQIHKAAQEKIEEYMKSTTPLTDSQIVDLARVLTVYANSDMHQNAQSAIPYEMIQQAARTNNGSIKVNTTANKTFFVINKTTKEVNWNNDFSAFDITTTKEIDRLKNIATINAIFANTNNQGQANQ